MISQGNLQIRRYLLFWQILQIREEKTPLSNIASPGPLSAGSLEVVLSNKDESRIGQLFMRSLNRAI